MFTKKSPETEELDKAITKVLLDMQKFSSDTEEFAKMTAQLERLYKLKEIESRKRVSPDTLALIAGNLAGIVLIISYERAHVITSKALGFVMKAR